MNASRSIIFDADGVLIDSMKYHTLSWQKAFDLYDIKPVALEMLLLEGMSGKETIDLVVERYQADLSEQQKSRILEAKIRAFEEMFVLDVYKGVYELLDQLQRSSMSMSVVTGMHTTVARRIMQENFNGYFDVVITGEDVKRGKPSPEPYLKAVDLLKIRPEEALVIENAPLGIQSAKRAELMVCALETTLSSRYLQEADVIFADHGELYAYLRKELTLVP